MQRRQHGRYRLWFPVQVTSQDVDGMAFNHNISAGGMLIAVSAKLEIDRIVNVRFRMPPDGEQEYALQGHIVRIEDNDADPEGLWPYRVAVAFEEVDESLIPFLEKAAEVLGAPLV